MKRYQEGTVVDEHVEWNIVGYAGVTAVAVNGVLGRIRLGKTEEGVTRLQLWKYIEELHGRGEKFKVTNNELFVERIVVKCFRDLSDLKGTITFDKPGGVLKMIENELEGRRAAGDLSNTDLRYLEKALTGARTFFGA